MAVGVLLLIADLHISGGGISFTPVALGALWHQWDAPSLNLLQAITERYVLPQLWSYVLLPLLLSPAWQVFFGFGAGLIALSLLRKMKVKLEERSC